MRNPTWMETAIFLVLLAISAIAFWLRLRVVLGRILAAKKDADFALRPLARRFRCFLWEVVCQGKVIRERPLAGLAHACVFWGFCVFGVMTLNHLAQGVGLGFLERDSWLGKACAVVAVVVAVSIAVLAARRFVARPKWLGAVSPESGFIAFLIFALMITYLAPESRAMWWLHTLALLVFLPLIPHTKHLHLALSPVTVFLRRGSFSKIPPLAGDEDFGLDTGKDVTRLAALQAYTCVECGRCMEHCPATNTGKLLNPKDIALGLRAYLNEFGPRSEEPLLGKHIAMEAAFQCTTCGACEYQCPVGIEHLPIIVGLRRGAVNTGKWEDDYGTKLFLALERNGNALGMAASERDKFIQKAELPLFDGSQEYCLWLGCMGAYDPQGREVVLAFAKLLRHLGISFGVLKKEKCTGDAARRLGNDLVFGELAQFNIEQIRSAGVKKMVSICPHCVRTIGEDWKEFGAAPPIEHHSELLARHRDKLPAAKGGGSIVFHDPCYLGRYRNLYAEPRTVVEMSDPPRARERSFCCGAGGGLMFLGEEQGTRIGAERARELTATGAETVGVACPFCHSMLRDALAGQPVRLADIAQIAAQNL